MKVFTVLTALLVLAAAMTPLQTAPARAQAAAPATVASDARVAEPTSRFGVAMAVMCGVSIRVAMLGPEAAIFGGIAAASCIYMALDALNEPDPH